MEVETKKSKGKEEVVRHWSDKDMKEIHKHAGKTWRSNKHKHVVIPVSKAYLENYSSIFGHG